MTMLFKTQKKESKSKINYQIKLLKNLEVDPIKEKVILKKKRKSLECFENHKLKLMGKKKICLQITGLELMYS